MQVTATARLRRWLILWAGLAWTLGLGAVHAATELDLTAEERAWLAAHPQIRLAPDPDFPPIEFIDAGGDYAGIAADYLDIARARLGIDFEIVRFDSWDEVMPAVRAGAVDMLGAVSPSPQRREFLRFSTPHTDVPAVIIVRKSVHQSVSLKELAGMRVSVVAGYVWNDLLATEHPQIQLDPVGDLRTGLRKVSFGITDAMIANLASATHYIEQEGITNLRVAGETPFRGRYGFAVRDDLAPLAGILDKVLATVPPERRQTILGRWVALAVPESAGVPGGVVWGLGGGAAVVVVLVLWRWRRLRRRLRQQRAEADASRRERQRTEEALAHSEQRFQRLIEYIPVAVFLCTREGRVRLANARAAELIGMGQVAALEGKRITDLVRVRRDDFLARLAAVLDEGAEFREEEFPIERPDRAHRCVMADMALMPLGGEPGVLVMLRDMTALKVSERRFDRSQSFANIGTWDWNIRTGDLYWSERIAPLFGYRYGELETSYENFLNAVHPADRAAVQEAVRACVEEGREYDIEHRVVWPNGSVRWVLERGDVVRDDAGEPLHMLGVVQDVTARKEADARMELAVAVIENTPEGVMITDSDKRIVTVNPAFTRTTGYDPDEVIGRTPSLLSSGRHGAEFFERMWQELEQTGQWQGEIWNRRKDGDVYPEWLNINVIRDSAGNVSHYAAIFSDLSTQEHVRERLHTLAYYDLLTGLPNRELLRDRLLNALAQARRGGTLVAVMFLDLDRFKTINDSLGHPVGDALLKAVAARLQASVRDNDTVARLGGDEFIIVLTGLTAPEDAAHVAAKIVEGMAEPIDIDVHHLFASTSVGISIYPHDGDAPDTLLKNADAAMYRAKERGRNTYQFYTREMGARSSDRLVLESELRLALERGELSLVYQPQIEVGSGRVVAVEALARWHNALLGRVPPDVFIACAEDMGIIGELGDWVLETALQQLRQWDAAGFGTLRLAVNLSGRQLGDDTLVGRIERLLREYDIDPGRLELELTESVLMEHADATLKRMAALRRLGVQLAVDDFGTGYSSLSYLKRFEVDCLKIDKSFVQDIGVDTSDTEIAATVVAMGKKLHLSVVAEGVETEQQYAFLAAQGCDLVQGYLFSPPQEPGSLAPLLARPFRTVGSD